MTSAKPTLAARIGNIGRVSGIIAVLSLVGGLGAVAVGLVWALEKVDQASRKRPRLSPREVLEMRFATGEIDETEFNRRMHRLTYGPPLELD